MFRTPLGLTVPDIRDSIKAKLEELGWTDIVSSLFCDIDLLQLPEVRKLEPLTPSGE